MSLSNVKWITVSRPVQWMIAFLLFYILLLQALSWFSPSPSSTGDWSSSHDHFSSSGQREPTPPLLFIGGCPRSGTTLMRVLLDAHPSVACGPETHILPKIILMHGQMSSVFEQARLKLAGIDKPLVNQAMRHFILDIIQGSVKKGGLNRSSAVPPLLCNKDPFLMNNAVFLKRLFPRAKFIFMIRDGRAVTHSIVSRKIAITKFNLTNYEEVLRRWNAIVDTMSLQCEKLGSACLKVYYEKLVLNPKNWLERIFRFLDLKWDDSVLHHEKYIASGDIILNTLERSTDQVIKPINPEALTSWVGKVPSSVLDKVDTLAPMLKILGYDPKARRPNYGKVDQIVKENMYAILAQKELWAQRAASLVQKRIALRDKLSALSAQYKVAKKDLKEKAGEYLLEQAKEDSEEAAKEHGLVLGSDK